MLPYTTGTVTLTQGSDTVTGTGTIWLANVKAGDLLTVDYSSLYPVESVTDSTTLVLTRSYTGETVSGQSYAIIRVSNVWNLNADVAARLTELINDFQSRLDDDYGAIKGDKGDSGFTVRGIWSESVSYSAGDAVARNNTLYICILDNTGVDPAEDAGTYWIALTVNVYTTSESDSEPA